MELKRRSSLFAHAQRRQKFRVDAKVSPLGLKERLAQIRRQSEPALESQSVAPWLEAAAVLATFNPTSLRAANGQRIEDDDVFADLIGATVPASTFNGLRTMELRRRQSILRTLGTADAMKAALAPNEPAPDTPLQQGFKILLEGRDAVEAVRETEDAELLAGCAEAMLWVDGILQDLPSRTDLMRDLGNARRAQPLKDLVGTHFAGREAVLERMKTYFEGEAGAESIFFLYGVGGAGKSTVLAKFAMDLRAAEAIEVFAFLNFDRPSLDIREPLTILREIVEQLSEQYQGKELLWLRSEIDDYMKRFAAGRSALESIHDGGGDWYGMISGVAEAIRSIPGEGPFLVLIDTFERAQKFGDSVVREFWRMLSALAKEAPRLRIIAAGRVDSTGIFQTSERLDGLERPAIAQVLESICGEPLDPDLVDAVAAATEGRPLGVRLAGILFKRIGLAKLQDPQTRTDALLEVQSEQAEAVLYNRILGQIANPRVKQIARKGILLRLVTPNLIRKVLAPAVGLELSKADADGVFEDYEREVDLVELGGTEWGEPMLTHRDDVRRLMLADLRDGEAEALAEIDSAAVAFFERQKGAMARAEEIYHRLWTDEPLSSIEKRWRKGCEVYLKAAVDEIPRVHRPWLANRVGIDLPKDAEAEADLAEWEAFAARTAQSSLNRGDPEGALKVLLRRKDRLPGSPLFAIEADANSRLHNVARALDVIDRGLESAAEAGARGQAAELWLVRSLISERERKFAAAGRDAARANGIARDLANTDMMLRSIATLLRLHRKSRNIDGPSPEDLVSDANAILDDIGDRSLLDQPGLMRSLAGELGPTRPKLLALTVQNTGSDTISTPTAELRAAETSATEMLSRPHFERVSDVIEQVTDTDLTLRDVLEKLIAVAAERGVLSDVAVPVAHLIAAEVDQLIGTFPSKSMQRKSGAYSWWRAAVDLIRSVT